MIVFHLLTAEFLYFLGLGIRAFSIPLCLRKRCKSSSFGYYTNDVIPLAPFFKGGSFVVLGFCCLKNYIFNTGGGRVV